MQKIQIIGARSYFHCLAVIVSGDQLTDVPRAIRRATVEMLEREENSEDHIEVQPFDFEKDDMDDFDTMVFFDGAGKGSDKPSDWVQRFINDYFPVGEADYTLCWRVAIERYARDLKFFEDAFAHPSDFPAVEGFEKTEYEVMRFLIASYSECTESSPEDSDRNRRNYYFLRYPRLRDALLKYRQATETP